MDLQHSKPREGSLGRATETRPKGLGLTTHSSGGTAPGPEMGWDQPAPFPIGGDPDVTIPYCAEPTTVAPGDQSTLPASNAGVRESAIGRQFTGQQVN